MSAPRMVDDAGLGTFMTQVLEPRMERTPPKGMFKRGSKVRVWISEDARRLPVRFKVEFKFGSGRGDPRRIPAADGAGGGRDGALSPTR